MKILYISPENTVGTLTLWKNEHLERGNECRTVTFFRSPKDFDEDISIQKTARKPQDALGALNKRSLKKQLKDMKTKEQTLTGRINGQTILLGVF